MTTEYKPKNNVPNLYTILGLNIDVCKDEKCDELIHKAFVKKTKACHPDKHPGRKDIAEIFELVTEAYGILKDEKSRNEYNNRLRLKEHSSKDFFSLKKDTTDYMDSIGEYIPPTDQQKISFKEQMKLMDNKHGFDETKIDPISRFDAKKKLNEMSKTRAQQDRDLKPENIFSGGNFDLAKFNAAFDKIHNNSDTSMVQSNGVPSAWNDMGMDANYSNFDNLDKLYVNDNDRFDTGKSIYGGVDFGESNNKKLSKEDMVNIKPADYTHGHNHLDENYYREMKSALRSRKADAGQFENMKFHDFKRDDTAGYGISEHLGFKIGDRFSEDIDEEDISKKFERIMADRQQELLTGVKKDPPKKKLSGR